jgi:hypothetical protein
LSHFLSVLKYFASDSPPTPVDEFRKWADPTKMPIKNMDKGISKMFLQKLQ